MASKCTESNWQEIPHARRKTRGVKRVTAMRYGVVYIEPILENPCPLVPPYRMWSTGQ